MHITSHRHAGHRLAAASRVGSRLESAIGKTARSWPMQRATPSPDVAGVIRRRSTMLTLHFDASVCRRWHVAAACQRMKFSYIVFHSKVTLLIGRLSGTRWSQATENCDKTLKYVWPLRWARGAPAGARSAGPHHIGFAIETRRGDALWGRVSRGA